MISGFALLTSGHALAQAADPGAASQADAEAGEITVTGSRIVRSDLSSNSPISTLDPVDFQKTGAITLEQTLNIQPQFVASSNASSNDNLTGGVTNLSLRGLGPSRTLVLLNSHRIVPSASDGSVDISMVPEALLSRVEVITGGASSTYGSDAIAGVVNFRLNDRFTGLTLDGSSSVTERGDAPMQKLSAAFGTALGDRGHLIAAATYSHRSGLTNADREFSAISRPSSSLTTGAAIQTVGNYFSQAAVNGVFSRYGVAPGTVVNTANLGFNRDGTLFKYSNGVVNYRGELSQGYSIQGTSLTYAATGPNGLVIPFERENAFVSGNYEILDGVTAYASGNYMHYTSDQFYAPVGITVSVPVTNGFIPSDLRTLLASRGNPNAPFSLTKRYEGAGLRYAEYDTSNYQVSGGLRGKLGLSDWTWDLYGSYGRVRQKRVATGFINTAALNSLLTAADGGTSRCTGGLNPFGNQPLSESCVDYLTRAATNNTIYTEKSAEANFQGKLLTLPYGDARLAVGAAYRKDTYDFNPDAQLIAGQLQSFGDAAQPAGGEISVRELYTELFIPLLADLPLIKELNATLGYRYSDYNVSGGAHTWKADGQWRVTNFAMIRGGYSRAIRAPSVGELFSPQAAAFPTIGLAGAAGQGDPCDVNGAYRRGGNASQIRSLCLAQGVPNALIDTYAFPAAQLTTGISGGNPGLKPEIAQTYTVGIVLKPNLASPMARQLSLSVDYYNIRVQNTIGTIAGALSIQKCFNYDGSNPSYDVNNIYCSFVGRDTTNGEISRVELINSNLGSLKTSGVDVAFNWGFDLEALGAKGDAGGLTLNVLGTYLDSYVIQNFIGGAKTDYAGSIGPTLGSSAKPRWKSVVNLTYDISAFQIGGQWRRIAAMKDNSAVGVTNSTTPGVPKYDYFDLNARIAVADAMTFRIGVTNLADKGPPVFTSFVQSNTDPGTYDIYGRTFYAGVTAKF